MNGIRTLGVAAGLAATLAMSGCLVTSHSSADEYGARVSNSTLNQVRVNQTTGDWLVATLGQPNSRTSVAGDPSVEIWKYDHSRNVSSSGTVLFLFSGSSSKRSDRSTCFELHNGIVSRYWVED